MRFFFICGAPKSGTTWLQRLLDEHPSLVCSGEGHFIEKLARPILQAGVEYNKHLALVAERVYEGKPYYPPLGQQRLIEVVRTLVIDLMSIRVKPGVLAIGDKTPRYTDFLEPLRSLFPDAHFIHITRDPRDVAVSRLHHALRAGYADALNASTAIHLELITNAARAWLQSVEQFSAFREKYQDQCLEVRYEDLSSEEAESVIGQILRFLKVADSPQLISSLVESASFEKWSGRPRGIEDKSSFFRKGSIGDGSRSLEQSALDRIRDICGFRMQNKGYN